MFESASVLPAGRVASLMRAAHEATRRGAAAPETITSECARAIAGLEAETRSTLSDEIESFAVGRSASSARRTAPAAAAPGGAEDLMKQRASLELKLRKLESEYGELDQKHRRECDEHEHAVESLSLQQRKLKELGDERSALLTRIGELESQFRKQINETDQVRLQFEKLKSSRRTMSDQSTELNETINELRAENERLRGELESSHKQREVEVADAHAAQSSAESETADAVLKGLWKRLGEQAPEVFVNTHVPTRETFDRLCDATVEFVRGFSVIEMHVHQCLKDLRQVGEKSDKLNTFYIMLTKKSGLLDNLKDYLITGRGKGNFTNLLRAEQVWARAFTSGLYKTIVQLPGEIEDALNPRNWPGKPDKDAIVGKYFKETVRREVPEKVGTEVRKRAGEMAYQDYNDLFKRR